MLSRVAESLFWLGRNTERAETIARVLDVNYTRAMDLYSQRESLRLWRSVMHCAGFTPDAELPDGPGSKAAAQAFAHCAFDPQNPSSILSAVRVARANALGIRAELTAEVWEVINVLYLFVEAQTLRGVMREGPSRFLRRVRDLMLAFAGTSDGTLTHGEGWDFLQLGRFLERGYMAGRILAALEVEREPWHETQRMLEMCCASVPFAQYSRRAPEPRDGLEYIVCTPSFPRSLRFCTRAADEALHRLSGSPPGSFANAAERRLGRLRAELDFTPFDELVAAGACAFGASVVREFEALSDDVQAAYFPALPRQPAAVL